MALGATAQKWPLNSPGGTIVEARGKILIISPWSKLWSMAPGAGVSDEAQMLPRLIQHGYEIHMLVPRTDDVMQSEPGLVIHTFRNVLQVPGWLPAPLKRLWLLPAFWWVAGRAAQSVAQRIAPKLVLGFSHYGARPAYVAGRAQKIPSVLKLFGVMHAMRLGWPLGRYLYHSLEAVLAFKVPLDHFIILNDGTLGRQVAERWGVEPDRVTYLLNGIDKDWAHQSLDAHEWRQRLGTDDETCVFLSLSRMVLSKRIDRIIDAVHLAQQQSTTPLQLWLAGDGPLRDKLQAQSQQLGVDTKFLGTLMREQIPNVLAASDALLSTSVLTNMSIPTCEAMVVGLPVIGLAVGGTDETIQHLENGLLVPEEDPAALSKALLQMATQPELRQSLGQNARRFAEENFLDWDTRVSLEIELIDRLVTQSAQPTER